MRNATVARSGALLLLALLSSGLAAKLKIVSVLPTSGPMASMGNNANNAAQLSVKRLQSELKAAGLDISIVTVDEQNPTVAAQGVKALLDDPEVIGIVGPTFSGSAILVSDVLKSANVPMVSGAATAADVTDRGYANVSRIVARSDAQGAAMAEYLAENTQHRKILVISDATTYGNGLAEDFQQAASGAKLSVVQRINTSAKSGFDNVLAAVREHKPDVIYFSGGQENALGLLRELRDAKLNTVVAGGSTFEDVNFVRNGKELVRGVLYTTTFGPLSKFTRATAFSREYQAEFKGQPANLSLFHHDAATTLLTAILNVQRQTGKTPTRAEVSAAMRKVSVPNAITGPIAFNEKGDRQRSPVFVMRFGDTIQPEYLEIKIARVPVAKP